MRIINPQEAAMPIAYNPNAPKKSANLSINSDLLNQAKALQINLSATLELALTEIVLEQQSKQWLHDNQQSIIQYNQRIEAEGCFSDNLRNF
jgi:antitoxin CcdA